MLEIKFTALFATGRAIYNPGHNRIFVTSRGEGKLETYKVIADVRLLRC